MDGLKHVNVLPRPLSSVNLNFVSVLAKNDHVYLPTANEADIKLRKRSL